MKKGAVKMKEWIDARVHGSSELARRLGYTQQYVSMLKWGDDSDDYYVIESRGKLTLYRWKLVRSEGEK